MLSLELKNIKGHVVGNLELPEEVYAVEQHQQAIFDTIIAEKAAMRQGTQKAKTRAEVKGGGRKPWRQKGTGRARQGSIRSPQWRGGGVVFAPVPREYVLKVNKKIVRLAVKCLLSEKIAENSFIAVENLDLENFKTKGFVDVLEACKAEGKVLVVLDDVNPNAELAGRNLPNVNIQKVNHVSAYQIANANCVLITKAAVDYFTEALK